MLKPKTLVVGTMAKRFFQSKRRWLAIPICIMGIAVVPNISFAGKGAGVRALMKSIRMLSAAESIDRSSLNTENRLMLMTREELKRCLKIESAAIQSQKQIGTFKNEIDRLTQRKATINLLMETITKKSQYRITSADIEKFKKYQTEDAYIVREATKLISKRQDLIETHNSNVRKLNVWPCTKKYDPADKVAIEQEL